MNSIFHKFIDIYKIKFKYCGRFPIKCMDTFDFIKDKSLRS